jgi:glutaconate CoA-transferase subunit A
MAEAAQLVKDGDMIAVGGMTLYRKPMAFVRELIRAGVRDLTFVGFTGSIDVDLMVAGGCVSEIRSCYIGLEYLGLAPAARSAVENQQVRMLEETENSIVLGLQAATMNVPYLPARDCCVGTDYINVRPDLRRAACPVSGEMLTWFPAIRPRVGVLHVPMADRHGNAVLGGQRCVDVQIAMAAEITILTTERIVETDAIRAQGNRAEIVEFMVEAVVEAPGGAHPTSCAPDYPTDVPHLIDYMRAGRKADTLQDYLSTFVHAPADHKVYLAEIARRMA